MCQVCSRQGLMVGEEGVVAQDIGHTREVPLLISIVSHILHRIFR